MYASGDDETETQRFQSEKDQPFFSFFLAEELITEILSWLPSESLMKFKCVSKSWNSLISNPSFIQLHLLRSSILPLAYVCVRNLTENFLQNPSSSTHLRILQDKTTFVATYASFSALNDFLLNPSSSSGQHLLRLNGKYAILGSCNGLVCLLNLTFREEYCHFLIWNPATRLVSQKLPGFHNAKPTHHRFKFGFGYDKLSHTYKLVAVRFDYFAVKDSDRTQVKVYNFGSGGGDGGDFFEMPDKPGSFDPMMVIFLDCMCLSYDCNGTHFIMWQMKEFGVEKSWTRFVNVIFQHLQIVGLGRILLLCISENGDVLILRNKYDEIILYNRKDNGVQLAHTISNQGYEIYVKGYAQSLISPC